MTSFEVAFVCTGNRFRSVLAAAVLESTTRSLDVDVVSFGTLNIGAAAAFPVAIQEADELGVDVSRHRARPLARADLSGADLVIGFELKHVVAAVETAGARVERTFVLSELADLLSQIDVPGDDPVERATIAVVEADAHRRNGGRRSVAEIQDPVGLPEAEQRAIARTVVVTTGAIARGLFPESAEP